MMTQRMIEILKAIIDEFINTAEPVASKTLVEEYHLPYSSATIRNDMAILEAEGYLEKPHTSAGRIPSNKGYKFYCENLLDKGLDDKVKYAVTSIFSDSSMNVEDCVKQSCRMISDMTKLTSGVLGPNANLQTLEHIALFPLDDRTAVCVFVTNTGHTENKTFNFKDSVSSEDIKTCTDILNDRLKGTQISDLKEKLESIKFIGAFTRFASEKLYFSGTSNLMYQPEYADGQKLKELIKIFDDPDKIKEIVTDDNGDQITAIMPKGTELIWKDDMAIVTTDVRLSKKEIGKLMVVGPRRMQYNRVLSLMGLISKALDDIYK